MKISCELRKCIYLAQDWT